jgi:hypothetical protein
LKTAKTFLVGATVQWLLARKRFCEHEGASDFITTAQNADLAEAKASLR